MLFKAIYAIDAYISYMFSKTLHLISISVYVPCEMCNDGQNVLQFCARDKNVCNSALKSMSQNVSVCQLINWFGSINIKLNKNIFAVVASIDSTIFRIEEFYRKIEIVSKL